MPARKVWDPLACPLCGTALVQDGHLHRLSSNIGTKTLIAFGETI